MAERPRTLRLHMSENTAGCAPVVAHAVRTLTPVDIATYPDYAPALAAASQWLCVDRSQLLLTNGLDDGLHAVAHRARTFGTAGQPGAFEAIVVEPAFEMFAAAVEAADGTVVRVVMADDFAFPLDAVLQALTPRTRLVFVNDPHNPSGMGVAPSTIERLARAAPQALVLVDEAYADYSGRTVIGPLLDRYRNVIVGRTWAKAHGLAGLRIGALVGHPETIAPIRARQPPYAVNAAAAFALASALESSDHVARAVAQAHESKALIYAWCRRHGLRCWPSEASFVLVRFGPSVTAVVDGLAARGILIRDRSAVPGCAGCARIAAGVVDHTVACLEALDDVLPAYTGAGAKEQANHGI